MLLGFVQPFAGILRVAALLRIELFACRVHDLEPFQLFALFALADVDGELVIEDVFLLLVR